MARAPKASEYFKPIHRVEGGWMFHVRRGGEGYHGWFTDRTFGGPRLSYLAAQHRFCRRMLEIGPDYRVRTRSPSGSRSKTGLVGVTLERHKVEGRIYHRYVAGWRNADQRVRRRRFQIEVYGKLRAKGMAVEARRAGLDQTRAELLVRQREEALRQLRLLPPMPRVVVHPRSRKGIKWGKRRSRVAQ